MSSPERRARPAAVPRVTVAAHELIPLDAGWELAAATPDAVEGPAGLADLDGWVPARVPGTVAGALRDAGIWEPYDERDLDREDWWFRCAFEAPPAEAGEEVVLRLDGIASVSEVFLNGTAISGGKSMFERRAADIGDLLRLDRNELVICCRALAPLLELRRKPRARWRSAVGNNALRHFRTMLLGRAPGFAPGPAAVGPWRGVAVERRRTLVVERLELLARCEGDDGVLAVRGRLRALDGQRIDAARIEVGEASAELALRDLGEATFELDGEVRVGQARRWWPHTHGEPVLHAASLWIETNGGELAVDAGRVGFRELAPGPRPGSDPVEEGLDLHLNGERVFVRGALWTPIDFVAMTASQRHLRGALEQVREAGMNMVRIAGTGAYECEGFHDLCDELGILVWQDLMFANFDYPFADEGFAAIAEAEAADLLTGLAGRPSLAVVCGNSEVEQQAAMLGLDPGMARAGFFGETVPALCAQHCPDVPYLPSAPCGGTLPFRNDRGIANYFGVGGYRRPLSDARLAGVRFASECLALANVPAASGMAAIFGADGGAATHDPRWKRGVPRDVGASWDFDDVRDHYLELLFGLDAGALRACDPERYLELSGIVSGELMAAVFGEWRRAASPCGGGLVLWLRDLLPGAGWGLLDCDGTAKPVLGRLARALAPIAVWATDEGLGGVGVHVANDGERPLAGRLRAALYRKDGRQVGEASSDLRLGAHESASFDLEALLGRFVDASWAYRFGPPAQDLIWLALEGEDPAAPLAAHAHLVTGPPSESFSAEQLGLEGEARVVDGGLTVNVRSRAFVYGVRFDLPGTALADTLFDLEPGADRTIRLSCESESQKSISLSATNLSGRLVLAVRR